MSKCSYPHYELDILLPITDSLYVFLLNKQEQSDQLFLDAFDCNIQLH